MRHLWFRCLRERQRLAQFDQQLPRRQLRTLFLAQSVDIVTSRMGNTNLFNLTFLLFDNAD